MDIKDAFAAALKQVRNARGLTQEAFSEVSSRTYVSTLERGLKSPTLEKINDLSNAMSIHPLTLLALTYLIESSGNDSNELLAKVKSELSNLIRPG